MVTRAISTTGGTTIEQVDIIFVASQVNKDIQSLSRAYPAILSLDQAVDLFNVLMAFMSNNAISAIGFTIYDPNDGNKVYHELKYQILYGRDVQPISQGSPRGGQGGQPVNAVWVPSTAKFTPWIRWSDHMLQLPTTEQQLIVQGTGWPSPNQGGSFIARYDGGHWNDIGNYFSGKIAASGKEYK